jgi:hypothetical protein
MSAALKNTDRVEFPHLTNSGADLANNYLRMGRSSRDKYRGNVLRVND